MTMNILQKTPDAQSDDVPTANPLSQFLTQTHATLTREQGGAVAD